MHFHYRNVNEAFHQLVSLIHKGELSTVRSTSRYGDILRVPEPMTFTYSHPTERVLLWPGRDANPFFHLYEALWMLAGRNDVASLVFYNSRMQEFSDDGRTLNGAYGHRWRHWPIQHTGMDEWSGKQYYNTIDQIELVIKHLKDKPDSRRAVIQMWNPAGLENNDLLKIDESKDVPCNLSIMFQLRQLPETYNEAHENASWGQDPPRALDMTVTNRSNDMVWGMLGANYVHFTILQEYVANCLGVKVGLYHHFTNDLHVYDASWEPNKFLDSYNEDNNIQSKSQCPSIQLVKDTKRFQHELPYILDRFRKVQMVPEGLLQYIRDSFKEPFLLKVAFPVLSCYQHYKEDNESGARSACQEIVQPDWQFAVRQWMDKRCWTPNKEKRNRTNP